MRHHFASTLALLGSVTFIAAAGCGSDDDSPGSSSGAVAGSAAAGTSSSAGTGGSGSGGSGTAGTLNLGVGGDTGSPEPTGSACQVAADCYAGLDTTELSGPAECIDKVEGGYCTHECETDADCCAVEGECRTGFKQVCASFENSGKKLCFLSCEAEDLVSGAGGMQGAGGMIGASGAAATDGNEYCEREAHPRFMCRSTGGGSENRRACLPDAGMAGAGGGSNEGGAGGAAGAAGAAAGGVDAGGAGAGGTDAGGAGAGGADAGGANGAGAPALP